VTTHIFDHGHTYVANGSPAVVNKKFQLKRLPRNPRTPTISG
jgi:hypothetical protein